VHLGLVRVVEHLHTGVVGNRAGHHVGRMDIVVDLEGMENQLAGKSRIH